MTEQERLELVSAVEAENHDELDDLAKKLDGVDTSLRQAGSDTDDQVTIDVEVEGVEAAIAQLEALDDRLDSIGGNLDRMDNAFDGGANRGRATPVADGRGVAPLSGTIQLERNPGLTAEGYEGRSGVDVIAAQRAAMNIGDDRSFFDRLRDDLDGAREEFEDIRFTMSNFYDIFAALIPLLGVFIGALPAAITGIVALGGAALVAAGALAGIGALGAMGMSMDGTGGLSTEPLQEALGDIREEFIDTFAPLARTFTPFVNDALSEVETMLGPLATAASGLEMFTDAFSSLTSTIGDTLPALVGMSLQFSSAVMPMLSELGTYLLSQDIFGFMANQLAASLPYLVRMGIAFSEIIPAVIRLSQGFLVFASGLLFGVSMMAEVINSVKILGPILGGLISLYLTLITASTLYSIVTGTAAKAVLRFALALGIKAYSALTTAIGAINTYTASTWGAVLATVTLLSVVTLGAAALGIMASNALSLSSNIDDATKNLKEFASISGGLSNTSLGASSSGLGSGQRSSAYGQGATTIINAGDRDSANRQQYSSSYERNQHVDSVFGG